MALVTLDIEKAAAGGRMLARHDGQVMLVSGAIPGEQVVARVERTGKGVTFAEVVDVVTPSPDRRADTPGRTCGGQVYAHIAYPRQRELKAEIIQDAFRRIGRVALAAPPAVIESPEFGYRMRARLHAQDGRLGFYEDGTHRLCAPATTGQLLPATCEWLGAVEETVRSRGLQGLVSLEVVENIAASQRACHLTLQTGVEPALFAVLADGLTGLSAQCADRRSAVVLGGAPVVNDAVRTRASEGAPVVAVSRDARAFFQGNRFLLERLVWVVTADVATGPVVDLYAGVGLFGLALAACGHDAVTVVEGSPVSGADLEANASPFGSRVRVVRESVERFLASAGHERPATVIVDPPRTGLSRPAVAGLIRMRSSAVVYVSCDVATLARDSRLLLDSGYDLCGVTGVDLFPGTAHVESVALFAR
jgi:23S rRNA (uracil1939-C5)-methyltransferase